MFYARAFIFQGKALKLQGKALKCHARAGKFVGLVWECQGAKGEL